MHHFSKKEHHLLVFIGVTGVLLAQFYDLPASHSGLFQWLVSIFWLLEPET